MPGEDLETRVELLQSALAQLPEEQQAPVLTAVADLLEGLLPLFKTAYSFQAERRIDSKVVSSPEPASGVMNRMRRAVEEKTVADFKAHRSLSEQVNRLRRAAEEKGGGKAGPG
jgi:hypothetical protein